MAPGLDPASAARTAITRANLFVHRWPAGLGRSLWQNTVIFQDSPADLSLGLWLACAGARVDLLCADQRPWKADRDPELFAALLDEIREGNHGLNPLPIEGINADSYRSRWGFSYHRAPKTQWSKNVPEVAEVILVDGLGAFGSRVGTLLRLIHRISQWSTSIEIRPRPCDQDIEQRLSKIRDEAIRIGFGAQPSEGRDATQGLSLVWLESPMSDHPVVGNATIMAHSNARLDVAAQLVQGKTVLDAGGWQGLGATRYLESGASKVVNVDLNADAIRAGKKALGKDKRVEFREWDLNKTPWPFRNASFDVVVFLEVLEHLREQVAAVRECRRVLKPGGVLLISVPDLEFENAWTQINRSENAFHLHVPDRKEFESLLSGFRSVRYLRQVDLTGSIIVPDDPSGRVGEGRFVVEEPYDGTSAQAQVIVAMAQKGGAKGKAPRLPARSAPTPSDLHVLSSATHQIIELRQQQSDQQSHYQAELFKSWQESNALTAEVSRWKSETQRLESQLAQARQYEARFETVEKRLEAVTASASQWQELASQHEKTHAQNSERWATEIRRSTNILNETLRQKSDIQTQRQQLEDELESTRRLLSEAQSKLAVAESEAVRAAQQVEYARGQVESARQETAQIRQSHEESQARQRAEAAGQIEDARGQVESARQEIVQIRQSHEESQARHVAETAELSEQNARVNQALAVVTSELESTRGQLHEAQAQIAQLQSEQAKLAARHRAEQAKLADKHKVELAKLVDQNKADLAKLADEHKAELAKHVAMHKAEQSAMQQERHAWRQHAEATLDRALELLERRTLTVEEKVYDLEEQMISQSIGSIAVNGGRHS